MPHNMTWVVEVVPQINSEKKPENSGFRRSLAYDTHQLPPSAIKTSLLERVAAPMLEDPPLQVRYTKGLEQTISDIIVSYTRKPSRDGEFTLIGPDTPSTHHVLTDTEIKVPLVVGLTQRDLERRQLPQLPDRNPYYTYRLSGDINSELQPVIGIVKPYSRGTIEGRLSESFRFFRLASKWILEQTFVDQALISMQQNGISSRVPAVNLATRETVEIEAGPYAIVKTIEQGGRTDTILNYASLLLAISAVRGTSYMDLLTSDTEYGPILDEVRDADYGNSETEFLYNTVKRAFMTKSLRGIPFPGDLRRIP